MKKLLILALAILSAATTRAQKSYTLSSPDGRLTTTVTAGEQLTYDIVFDGRTLLESSPLSLKLTDGREWGPAARIQKSQRTSVDTTIPSPFYRSSEVLDRYNGLILKMRGNWSVEFRAYDDGIAYRFATTEKVPFEIENEQAEYRFPADYTTTVPYVMLGCDGDFEKQFRTSFENIYTTARLSELNPGRLAFLPLMVDLGDGMKLCITESDLNDYPGMFLLNEDGGCHLKGRFAPRPKDAGRHTIQKPIRGRETHIAQIDGPRAFPWRIAVVGTDTSIASSDLSYLLAEPSQLDDTSWIKPGKVSWDWWNDWNLSGVAFRAAINTETYKYYIDFAAEKGIEYVILDDGWTVKEQADLMQVVPEIDMRGIVEYATAKNVGIILWATCLNFDRDMEAVCKHYSEMGVKGFKVDFMDRDDQMMTDFNHRAAAMTAKYRLILDLHGTHKPAGLNRTWPNVLNFEGVYGLEQMKWAPASVDQIKYDVQIPFIRQVAGPMDYTPGAMRNASQGNYYPCYSEPMSQGTRCHQLALYVVLDSPLNMLCDTPTNYLKEPECTKFIVDIPTVWDETRILDGRMGEYIITARRKGSTWYIGGITDWTPREIAVDLSFLDGTYDAELFRDGINADRKASDYKRETIRVSNSEPLKIKLAPGGGFTLKIEK